MPGLKHIYISLLWLHYIVAVEQNYAKSKNDNHSYQHFKFLSLDIFSPDIFSRLK